MTTYKSVVVVGASLAGWNAAQALRAVGHKGRIVVIGAEDHPPYDRPPLSKRILTGRATTDDLSLPSGESLDVDLRLGVPAEQLDLSRGLVTLADGASVGFDGLVIATGCHPRRIPGLADLRGVHVLRTIDDAIALRAGLVASVQAGRAGVAVIGGGFIGLEVASSAIAIGLDVSLIEMASVPLLRSLGPEIGRLVADWHREHGVDVRLGVGLDGLVGAGRVAGVRLSDARGVSAVVPADVVVVGVGVAPTTGWLAGSGVDLDDGVRTDSRLRVLGGGVAIPHVVAAGDVARWDHPVWGEPARVEHWTNAVEQAHAAVASLIDGDGAAEFAPVPYFWSDQFDRKIQMVGRARPGDEVAIVDGSVDDRRFVAAYGRAGRLTAAVGFSRPAKVMALRSQIADGAAFPPA